SRAKSAKQGTQYAPCLQPLTFPATAIHISFSAQNPRNGERPHRSQNCVNWSLQPKKIAICPNKNWNNSLTLFISSPQRVGTRRNVHRALQELFAELCEDHAFPKM